MDFFAASFEVDPELDNSDYTTCWYSHFFERFERKRAGFIWSKNFIIVFPLKKRSTSEKLIEDNPKAKDITGFWISCTPILNTDDLRSHIARGSTSNKQIATRLAPLGKSEISKDCFVLSLSSKKNVLRLDISVHYFVLVHKN